MSSIYARGAGRICYIVRMGDGRFLLLDDEGEAERIDDEQKATRFDTYKAAEKAAWAFQASPEEKYECEQRLEQHGRI